MSNYLPLVVRKTLMDTGWAENEVMVYSVLLEKGGMSLTNLASAANIPISSLQHVLKKLLFKKMIQKSSFNDNPFYIAGDVEQLRKWIRGYKKRCELYEHSIDSFITQYDFNPQMYTPKVRMYEGLKGVKQSYKHMLEEIRERQIFNYFYITDDEQDSLKTFFDEEFIPERMKKGVFIRSLVVETIFSRYYSKKNEVQMREIKFLAEPMLLDMNTEINLYDNYMHCMSCNKEGEFAMIIEDKNMVELQKTFFKKIWDLSSVKPI